MVAAVVDIWKMALGRIAEQVAPSDPLDTSQAARWCQLYWPNCLDRELEAFDWSFARRVVSPAVLTDVAAPDPWAFALAYPGGAVTVRGLFRDPSGRDDPLDYELFGFTSTDGRVDGRALASLVSDGWLAYTRRVTDVTLYPPGLVNALAWGLASDVAGSMVRSAEAQKWCLQAHEDAQGKAWAYGGRAQSRSRVSETDSPLIQARY